MEEVPCGAAAPTIWRTPTGWTTRIGGGTAELHLSFSELTVREQLAKAWDAGANERAAE